MSEDISNSHESDPGETNTLIAQKIAKLLGPDSFKSYTVPANNPKENIVLQRLTAEEITQHGEELEIAAEILKNWKSPIFKIEFSTIPAQDTSVYTPYGKYPPYVLVGGDQIWLFRNEYYFNREGNAVIAEDLFPVVSPGEDIHEGWRDITGGTIDQLIQYNDLNPSKNDAQCIPLNEEQQLFIMRQLDKIDQ